MGILIFLLLSLLLYLEFDAAEWECKILLPSPPTFVLCGGVSLLAVEVDVEVGAFGDFLMSIAINTKIMNDILFRFTIARQHPDNIAVVLVVVVVVVVVARLDVTVVVDMTAMI